MCGYHGWTYGLDGRAPDDSRVGRRASASRSREQVAARGPRRDVGTVSRSSCLDARRRSARGGSRHDPGGDGAPAARAHDPLQEASTTRSTATGRSTSTTTSRATTSRSCIPELFQELDYGAYKVETAEYHSKQHAPIRSQSEDSLYRRSFRRARQPEALYYWVFPNLMLNLYPDNLQTNLIVPLSAERTLTRFEWYVLEPNSPGVAEEFARSFAFTDEVQQEDIGDLRGRAEGPRVADLRPRTLLGAARERRAPLPPAVDAGAAVISADCRFSVWCAVPLLPISPIYNLTSSGPVQLQPEASGPGTPPSARACWASSGQ